MTQTPTQSLAEIMGLTGVVAEVKEKQTNVIDSFTLDNEVYREAFNDSKEIQDVVQEGNEIIRTFDDFGQDLYMSLYKHKPKLLEEEDVKKTHRFNHKIMQEMMEMDEFRQLRKSTRLDMTSSVMGMSKMAAKAVEIIREYEQEAKNSSGGAPGGGGMQSPFKDINDQMDQQGQGGGPGDAGEGEPEQGEDQGDSGEAETPINEQAFEDAMNKMRQAVSEVEDEVSETREFLKSWGMDEGNRNNRVTFEDKRVALERLRKSPKVRKLTDIVGRMKHLAVNEKPEKNPDGAQAVKDVVTGDRIETLLPSELTVLASKNPALKSTFYKKYSEKGLLQYEKDTYESLGKGPMIVCTDCSGSMSGEREHWSKAVALALLEVAQQQKRNFAAIHYASRVDEVWEIPKGELRPNDIFDIAEKFSSGGTNFMEPLRKSLEILQKDEFGKSDIVFITDGDCDVDDEFMEEFLQKKRELGFHVLTVLIDMGGGGAMSTVRKFSDKIVEVSNLAKLEKQEKGALDIFRSIT